MLESPHEGLYFFKLFTKLICVICGIIIISTSSTLYNFTLIKFNYLKSNNFRFSGVPECLVKDGVCFHSPKSKILDVIVEESFDPSVGYQNNCEGYVIDLSVIVRSQAAKILKIVKLSLIFRKLLLITLSIWDNLLHD